VEGRFDADAAGGAQRAGPDKSAEVHFGFGLYSNVPEQAVLQREVAPTLWIAPFSKLTLSQYRYAPLDGVESEITKYMKTLYFQKLTMSE
jgi:hypothetical protein